MLSQLFRFLHSKNEKVAQSLYNELFGKNVWFLDQQEIYIDEQEVHKLIQQYKFDKENKKLLSIVLASIVKKFTTIKKNCKVNLDFELEMIHELLEKGADPNTEFKGDKAIYKEIYFALPEDDDIEEIYQFKLRLRGKYNDLYKDIVDDKIKLHHITFSDFTTSSITALHIAAYYGAIDLVNTLLKNGADSNIKDQKGNTAMHFALAAIVQKKNFFRKTEQSKGDISFPTEQQQSDVSSQFKIIKLLTLAGADTNISIHCANFSRCNSPSYDYTPIYLAVVCGKLDVASTLVEYGVEINFIDTFGYSPLNYAVERKNYKLVKLLIDYGANIDWRCNKKTMLEYSVENKMQYISFLLLMKKYYHDSGASLPLLYQVIELCFEKIFSKSFMMEDISNISMFTNNIMKDKNLFEEELIEWKDYLKFFGSSIELNNLCGFDALKNIVEKATKKLTNRTKQIEQCSNLCRKSQSLDTKNFPQENSSQQVQCLLQDENDKKDKSQSKWQLIADNLEEISSQRAQSQSRWQLIARRLRDLIGFEKSNEVSSQLNQTQVVSQSTVDLRVREIPTERT